MIEVTERAKKELKGLLTSTVDHPEACLRLRTGEEGKLGLGIDVELPGDQVVEHEGSKLLVVEAELANSLKNVAIDVEDSDEGRQFIIIDKPQ
jgi:Fe-S cluster assembly iron-binding protein IscA